jgi:hypothetical protein
VDLNIPKGAKIYLGAPAKPLDEELVLRIAELAASFPTVVEAHLPQCWVENVMPSPAQILVLVLATDEGAPELANAVGEGISRLLPNSAHMDVWKLSINHDLMPAVRKAGCGILGPDRKPIQTSSLKRLLKRFKLISR